MKHLTEAAAISAARVNVEAAGGLVDFNGQNCNDYNDEANCGGWDGEDRRCDCGNRRVFWDVSGNPADGFVAEAMAY